MEKHEFKNILDELNYDYQYNLYSLGNDVFLKYDKQLEILETITINNLIIFYLEQYKYKLSLEYDTNSSAYFYFQVVIMQLKELLQNFQK